METYNNNRASTSKTSIINTQEKCARKLRKTNVQGKSEKVHRYGLVNGLWN